MFEKKVKEEIYLKNPSSGDQQECTMWDGISEFSKIHSCAFLPLLLKKPGKTQYFYKTSSQLECSL